MSLSMMMYPRSLPWEALKVHFSRFSLMLNHQRLLNVSSRLEMRLPLFQDFVMMSST
jgi:hypothetical protein